jgi:HK97 family phage portal protein
MFLTKFRADGVDDRSPWGDFWFEPIGVHTSSGQRVSGDTALKLSVVFACVRVLAETMATLPFVLYREKKGGGKDVITDHWLYELLAKRSNRWQNSFEWREMEQGHIALRGTGYNRIVANSRGEIQELQPLHPDRVKVEVLPNGTYRYRVKHPNGQDEILPPAEVFKVAGLSSNGLTGLSVIECARESIGEGLAQQDFSSRFFSNDARPLGGWIEFPGSFKDKEARAAWRESWQQAQSGANRGKTAVLENGMLYHEIGLTNRDSQFIEAKAAKIPDICRWFRMPPHLVGDLSRSTNNNIEQQSLEFVTFTMTPWAERWEAAIEDQLLGEEDGLCVEFDFANLLRGDYAARSEFYGSAITNGWMTRNEARISESLDPLPGLDEPLEPLNMQPAGTKPKKPRPGTAPAPADDAPTDDGEDPKPKKKNGSVERLQSLTLAIAGRIVRKEVTALRKMRKGNGDARSWEERVREFYGKHATEVRESLNCSPLSASAWCARQLAELLAGDDVEVTLESWETSAAAELATRAQCDAAS